MKRLSIQLLYTLLGMIFFCSLYGDQDEGDRDRHHHDDDEYYYDGYYSDDDDYYYNRGDRRYYRRYDREDHHDEGDRDREGGRR